MEKMNFLRRLVLNRKIRGVEPTRVIRRGWFNRVYCYDIHSHSQYRKAMGRIQKDTKVISYVGIN